VGALWFPDQAEGKLLPALKDLRVRQAINMVFDREAIATKLLGPGSGPTNQLINPSSAAFNEDLLSETPFDVAKAKSLMAEAGYADGFAVTMPSTVVSTQVESTITQSLKEIGIDVTWEPVAFQDFYAKVYGGSYGMFYMVNGLSSFAATDINGGLSGVYNPTGYSTPDLDALRKTADAASEADQPAAFEKVSEYLVDQAWAAPLLYSSGFWVAAKRVTYTSPTQYNLNLLPYAPATS
jgi:peptide/nickel transport system substrate-binding protein